MKTRVKTRVEIRVKNRVKIIELVRKNNKITRQELAEIIGVSIKGIDWNIAKLKEQGKLKRIGPDKGGHWEIDKANE